MIKYPDKLCARDCGMDHKIIKDDFQSVLRKLRVYLHFCFEFVDTLHFDGSVHEVLMKFLSPPLRIVELLNAR